eukprot:CAMPEP_0119375254 /NCGR_PEP_ID=MMETSP1334-20130426/34611_1 /TAXON_ID=127549 /ORGANISM="Calcidiscus leptoporus, Strain RCC1130" /LENGTH=120 /DNA_ID=CAMNT_0007393509 /DNA_START=273 /DNA_END=632 /DNA_ORIENTATION=+
MRALMLATAVGCLPCAGSAYSRGVEGASDNGTGPSDKLITHSLPPAAGGREDLTRHHRQREELLHTCAHALLLSRAQRPRYAEVVDALIKAAIDELIDTHERTLLMQLIHAVKHRIRHLA